MIANRLRDFKNLNDENIVGDYQNESTLKKKMYNKSLNSLKVDKI